MVNFELGKLVATKSVRDDMDSDIDFSNFVLHSLQRYCAKDWGEMCETDKKMNDEAINNNGRIFAKYDNPNSAKGIYIVTEYNRSATTILFPDEY